MKIIVEFFGIPRLRAARERLIVELPNTNTSATLAEILTVLAVELPDFARACLAENQLRSGYIANVNGERFVTDPNAKLLAGDHLLILSADAGG